MESKRGRLSTSTAEWCVMCVPTLQLVPKTTFYKSAEVAVLCITKSGEVLNYQAFTNSNGRYVVAETMPESERWDACLARPVSSFHNHCTHLGDGNSGVKFNYNHPSGYFHTVRPFVYRPTIAPAYCI
ncbi:hypothetical protein OROHE_022468 [Orobanche hederae]